MTITVTTTLTSLNVNNISDFCKLILQWKEVEMMFQLFFNIELNV